MNAGTTVGNGKAAGGFATASTSGSSHSTVDSSKYDSLDPTVRDVTRSDTAAPAAGKLPDHVIRKVLELLVTEAVSKLFSEWSHTLLRWKLCWVHDVNNDSDPRS